MQSYAHKLLFGLLEKGIRLVTISTSCFPVFVFVLRWLTILCVFFFLRTDRSRVSHGDAFIQIILFAPAEIINYGNGNQKATSAMGECGNQNRHIWISISIPGIHSCHVWGIWRVSGWI